MEKKETEEISKMSNREIFDWYIRELNDLYNKKEQKAVKFAKDGLEELGLYKPHVREFFPGMTKQKLLIVFLCFGIVLCGFLVHDLSSFAAYIFGCIFFFAGLFVGLHVPVFGLIFLFSHGGSGLFVMFMALFSFIDEDFSVIFDRLFHNPIISDGGIPSMMLVYFILTGVILVAAFFYTVIYNLSPKLQERKNSIIQILILFFVGILLVALFPRIFSYLF